jgi:hypothetical protein
MMSNRADWWHQVMAALGRSTPAFHPGVSRPAAFPTIDVHELARELTAATAALEVQVAARAHELAAPRIEAAEAIYEARAAALEQQNAIERNRYRDLLAEMRRQYKASDNSRNRLFDEVRDLRRKVSEHEMAAFNAKNPGADR